MPSPRAAAPPRALLLAQETTALGHPCSRRLHRSRVRGPNFEIVLKLCAEDGSCKQGIEDIGEQQVGHGAQLVPVSGRPGATDSQPAQLLNQPPYFGAGGAYFLRYLGAAHDHRSM